MRVSKCVFFMILKRCLTSTIWKVNSNVISLVQIGIQSNSEYTVKGSFVCQTPALLAVRLHQETDRGTNDHTAPHMHLPVVTWIFWSHGFHGNRAIVLTGNEEGCISSLLHYTTTHTHKHTVCDVISGMKLKLCYEEKVRGDWYSSSSQDIPGASNVRWKMQRLGWHFENCLQSVYKTETMARHNHFPSNNYKSLKIQRG